MRRKFLQEYLSQLFADNHQPVIRINLYQNGKNRNKPGEYAGNNKIEENISTVLFNLRMLISRGRKSIGVTKIELRFIISLKSLLLKNSCSR